MTASKAPVPQSEPTPERPPVYVYRRHGTTYTGLVDPRPFPNVDMAPVEWFAIYAAVPQSEPMPTNLPFPLRWETTHDGKGGVYLTPIYPSVAPQDAPELTDEQSLREALTLALDLSKYAAAPFFSTAERRRDEDGEPYWIQPTTAEWWHGLSELIEAAQPKIAAALARQTGGTP